MLAMGVLSSWVTAEDGVQHDTGDEDREENEAQDVHRQQATVVVDPGDVEDDGEHGEAHAQRDEKRFGSAATCDVHKTEDRGYGIECRGENRFGE
jgi:hypothetical protein